jgi:putative transcriptional regulator
MSSYAPRLAVNIGTLLVAAAGAAADRETTRLRPGVFLYASPDLHSPPFTQSVILLVRHQAEGSLGLIINRPTPTPVGEAFPRVPPLRDLDLALYLGGPVQPEAMLALVRSARPVREGLRVLPDVYFCTDLDQVEEAARKPDAAHRLRVYAGYSGWGPGQLAGELRRGSWVVAPADARSVFTADPAALWPRVRTLLRSIVARAAPPGSGGISAPASAGGRGRSTRPGRRRGRAALPPASRRSRRAPAGRTERRP